MFEQIKKDVVAEISNLHIAQRSRKGEYKEPFFTHLDDLKQFEFIAPDFNIDADIKRNSYNFKMVDYLGLEQYVFDNTSVLEDETPQSVDWDEIDNLKDRLEDRIKKLLGPEKKSTVLSPVVKYTIDAFESYIIYQQMHPKSFYNPYLSTHEMLKDGYLYLIDNKEDIIKEFSPKEDRQTTAANSIGILTKASHEKKFRTVILDQRFRLQNIVLKYLIGNAMGHHKAKSKKKIKEHLSKIDVNIRMDNLNSRALLPMKRVGLIGSSSNGFYYIGNTADLRKSFNFHKSKYDAIRKTLEIYKLKGASKGVDLHF